MRNQLSHCESPGKTPKADANIRRRRRIFTNETPPIAVRQYAQVGTCNESVGPVLSKPWPKKLEIGTRTLPRHYAGSTIAPKTVKPSSDCLFFFICVFVVLIPTYRGMARADRTSNKKATPQRLQNTWDLAIHNSVVSARIVQSRQKPSSPRLIVIFFSSAYSWRPYLHIEVWHEQIGLQIKK